MAFSDTLKKLMDQGAQASKEFASAAGVKAQELGEKGYRASKDLAAKAGAKAQELGERGVLMLEIKKLEGQTRKLVGQLGAEVYHAFVEKGAKTVSVDTAAVKTILSELAGIRETLEKKERELQNRKGR
ncbi:MAG: hypothetical protein LBL43_04825 [Treponema sp.]|nr:hypothetical protein [Treponema sp.]